MNAAARRRRPGRTRLLALAAAVLVVAAAAALLWPRRGEREVEIEAVPPPPAAEAPAAAIRSVVLVFGNERATGTVNEQRQLPGAGRLEDELLAVLQALCDGPSAGGGVAVIPRGTRPLGVFYSEKDGSAVIDFSREIVANHPGGSAGEQMTIAAIMRTIALNFPEVRSCTILVAGAQVETLAGHIGLAEPLEPRRWL